MSKMNKLTVMEEIQESIRDLVKSQKETARQQKETDLQVKQTSKTVGDMTNKWGLLTEQFAKSKLPLVLEQFGYSNFMIHDRAVSFRKNETQKYEYDIITVNGEVVVPVEVKYNLHTEDVDKHIERLYSFREDLPNLAREKVFGAMVCILLNDDAKKYAIEKGLLLIQVAGEASNDSKVLNPQNFQLKNFI